MTNCVHIVVITKNDVTSLVIVCFSRSRAFWKAVDLQSTVVPLSNGTIPDADLLHMLCVVYQKFLITV